MELDNESIVNIESRRGSGYSESLVTSSETNNTESEEENGLLEGHAILVIHASH